MTERDSPAPDAALDDDAAWRQFVAAAQIPQPPFPEHAVPLAEAHREAFAPRLLAALQQAARGMAAVEPADSSLHLWAIVLLAKWRDTRAWAAMRDLAGLPFTDIDELLGDALHETFGRALASVCPGPGVMADELPPLIEDERRSAWLRMALLDAWVLRVLEGLDDDAPLVALLARVGARSVERTRRGDIVAAEPPMHEAVAAAVGELAVPSLVPVVQGWFDAGLIDRFSLTRHDFEGDLQRGREGHLRQMREGRRALIEDARHELRWWSGWRPPEPDRPARALANEPIVRATPKVGRNDPCPCGSGKKFKKCHGA